jgi:hypothetical protein
VERRKVAHAVAEVGLGEVWLAGALQMERPLGKHPVVPAESRHLAIPRMGSTAAPVDEVSAAEALGSAPWKASEDLA